MLDLNDLHYYAEVVAHGGFAQAGRALGKPKSKLSRRIAKLEEHLGVRLIERSTRRFRVTEVGRSFYDKCRNVLSEAESAEAAVAEVRGEPRGPVRFSCPPGMLQILNPLLPDFLRRFPDVRLQILSTNAPVQLIEQGIDVAMRLRTTMDSDVSLTMRTLAPSSRILVAAPALAAKVPQDVGVDCLSAMPTIGMAEHNNQANWSLIGPDGLTQTVRLAPRLVCGELTTVKTAALAGIGVAFLPDHVCRGEIADGTLVRVLPEWSGPPGKIHLVFTTRRGLPPAVRVFIDFLAAAFDGDLLLGAGPDDDDLDATSAAS